MDVLKSIIINKPLGDVWKLIAEDFGSLQEWRSGVVEIECHTDGKVKGPKGTITGRTITSHDGSKVVETFLQYSEENHSFIYQVDGLPDFVTSCTNIWSLEYISDTETKLTFNLKGTFNWFPGILMQPFFTFVSAPKILTEMGEEAKVYLETGKPHERKVKELEGKK